MSSYRKGRSAEHYVKTKLESMGYIVFRCAGSKPIDLLAFHGPDSFAIEVKAVELGSAHAEKIYCELEQRIKGTALEPMVIYKRGGHYVYYWRTKTLPLG